MKKVKITFRFTWQGEAPGTMGTTHEGEGVTLDAAIGDAWQNMAKDNFNRNLIIKTKSIEVISTTPLN